MIFIDLCFIGNEATKEVNNLIDKKNAVKKKRKKIIINYFKKNKIEEIYKLKEHKTAVSIIKKVMKDMHTYLGNRSKHNNNYSLSNNLLARKKMEYLNEEIMKYYLVPLQKYFDGGSNLNDFIQAANSGRGKVTVASTNYMKISFEDQISLQNRKNTDSRGR